MRLFLSKIHWKSKYTGRVIRIKRENNMIFNYPELCVYANCPLSVGYAFSACLSNPVYDFVIGQIDGVKDNEGPAEVGVISTRHQLRQKIKSQPKLRVSEVTVVLKSKDVGEQQKDEKTLDRICSSVESRREFF